MRLNYSNFEIQIKIQFEIISVTSIIEVITIAKQNFQKKINFSKKGLLSNDSQTGWTYIQSKNSRKY